MRECANCRFFQADQADEFYGQCRRNPPVVMGNTLAQWPRLHSDDWCGRHQRAEDAGE